MSVTFIRYWPELKRNHKDYLIHITKFHETHSLDVLFNRHFLGMQMHMKEEMK